LSLVPGVGQATTVTATSRFNGSRRNQSEFTVDGISNVTSNGTQISPLTNYIESFQELRVDSANNLADAGAIGQVTVVSKSGSNQLHGSLFDYYVTPLFRARDFFASRRDSSIQHRPGGSIGGPIVLPHIYNGHDKTFFFFDFETSRGSSAQQNFNLTVPLAAWHNGDFSNLLSPPAGQAAIRIKDPQNPGTFFPGNIVLPGRLNQTAVQLQNLFYPLPTSTSAFLPAQNFQKIFTHPFDPNTFWTTRIDHRFSQKTLVYLRWTWQRQYNTNYDTLPTVGRIYDVRNTRNAVASWSQVLNPSLVNEVRYGYAFTNEPRWGAQDGGKLAQQLGLQGLVPNQPDLPGVPNISFSGLNLAPITQQVWRSPGFYNKNHVIQEQLSWTHGKHTIHGGLQIGHYHANDVTASTALYGSLSFNNRYTGFPYADFLLGLPNTMQRAPAPLDAPFIRWAYDFFATDEYKVSPRLTVNFGMRYELHPAWGSGNGRASLFDVKSGQIVIQDGSMNKVSPLLPTNYVKVVTASQAGYHGSALIDTDKNNFAPRLGVAWRPLGEKTVFRAGFGVFYDIVPTSVNMAGVPFTVNEPQFTNSACTGVPCTPQVVLPSVYPNAVMGPATISLPGAFKKDLRIPYSLQYNVTFEREMFNTGLRISYVGTSTRQSEYVYNYNQPIPSTTLYVNKPRPFPAYPAINFTTNGGSHQYNGLNIEAKRRFTKGLLYDVTWTYARDIGDLERDQSPENSFDIRRERGVWADIPKHRVTSDFIYMLPFGHGQKWLAGGGRLMDLLVGGWQLTGITAFNTGQFLTPIWQGNDPTNTSFTTGTAPTVNLRPNFLHDPNLPSDQQTIKRWFDTTAFGPPSPGSFGTSRKGVIVGPSSVLVNAGIAKEFRFSERFRARWEFTGTNVLNHTNFDNPGLTFSNTPNTSFGVINSDGNTGAGGLDASGARAFRMGVRLEW